MLSDKDARVLRDMEEQLAADDPRFAATMTTPSAAGRTRGRLAGPARTVALTLALVIGVFGIAVGAVGSGLLLILAAMAVIAVRRGWWAWFRKLGEAEPRRRAPS